MNAPHDTQPNEIIVRCDGAGCDWEQPVMIDQAAQYHGASCPKCGHAPILSDADAELIAGILALRDAGMATVGAAAEPPPGPCLNVHFDTRGLRRKGFALVDLLAFILAALLLVLCSMPVFAPLTDDAAACTTDSQCAELCRPDDDECDGGPQS